MINQVPIRIMEAARTVTLKHPNALDCMVYRKQVLRTADDAMGGSPTLGGLGVLNSEDEADFEYVLLGAAKILFTTRHEPSGIVDLGDGLVPAIMMEALIEAVDVPGFTPKKDDLLGVMPGGGVLIGYQIIEPISNVNIYPYTTKYVVSPRDELHDLEPWTPAP